MDNAAHFHDRKDRLQNQLGVEEKEVTDPALLRGEGPEKAKDVAPAGYAGEDGRGDGVSRRRGRPARADQVVCDTGKSYKRDDCPRKSREAKDGPLLQRNGRCKADEDKTSEPSRTLTNEVKNVEG